MIIRFTYLASALSLAAASKSAKKTPGTPSPTDAAKASKSNTPIASIEYFLAPFSCPKECISAHGYEPDSHLLEDAVVECDANDSYQKWKVHRVGGLLKFESAAEHDHDMCLAVVHQDPEHDSNSAGYWIEQKDSYVGQNAVWFTDNKFLGSLDDLRERGYFLTHHPGRRNLLSEDDIDGMCSDGKLGMADCNHPGSYWYSTGGSLLSALCWGQGTSTAMSVDGCTADSSNVVAVDTSGSGDLTTSETFMLLGY